MTEAHARGPRIVDIPVGLIDPRPDQPRQRMRRSLLRELTESVRIHGILQPIRVRPKGDRYQVIAGARRLSAAREAGLSTVPAMVVEVGDDEAYLEALVENIQREDLNPVDRAHALMRLRVSLGIQTWEEVGTLIGIRRAHVYRLLNITKLPEEIREDIRIGDLTEKHGRALLSLRAYPGDQFLLWHRIHAERLSGDDAIRLASSFRRDSSGATPAEENQTGDLAGASSQSRMPTREVETGNDGTTPYVLDGEESHVDAVPLPPLTMPPARRRDLMEAIQRMSQALAAAVPEECAAMSAELALLGERIRAALESCKASHSMPTE